MIWEIIFIDIDHRLLQNSILIFNKVFDTRLHIGTWFKRKVIDHCFMMTVIHDILYVCVYVFVCVAF